MTNAYFKPNAKIDNSGYYKLLFDTLNDPNFRIEDFNDIQDEWYNIYIQSKNNAGNSKFGEVNENVRSYQDWYNKRGFNNYVVANNQDKIYSIGNSGDNPKLGWTPDGVFGANTYLRRVLNFTTDKAELQKIINTFNSALAGKGYETYFDNNGLQKIREIGSTIPTAANNAPATGTIDYSKLDNIKINDEKGKPLYSGSGNDTTISPLNESKLPKVDTTYNGKPIFQYDENGNIVGTTEEGAKTGYTLNSEGEILTSKLNGTLWNKLFGKNTISKALAWLNDPLNKLDLAGLGRVLADNALNAKYTDEYLRSLRTPLSQPYQIHRRVLGDYAGQRLYYDLAARLENKANLAFSSDTNLILASRLEAFDKANRYRLQGDILDNKAIRETSETAQTAMAKNMEISNTVANKNIAVLAELANKKALVKHQNRIANMQNIDKWFSLIEGRRQELATLQRLRQEALEDLVVKNQMPNRAAELLALYTKKYAISTTDPDYETKIADINQKIQDIERKQTEDAIKFYELRYGISPKSTGNGKYTFKDKYKSARHGGIIVKGAEGMSFILWTPPTAGSPQQKSTSSSTKASSTPSKSSSSSDEISVKDIANAMKGVLGLNSDYDLLMSQLYVDLSVEAAMEASPFGKSSLSSSSLVQKYLLTLDKINKLKRGHDEYKNAYAQAKAQGALDEIAVTGEGYLFVLDKVSKSYQLISPAEYLTNRDRYLPLTNSNLLYLRDNDPKFAFNNSISNIVLQGTSLSKIALTIQTLIGNLGRDTVQTDKYVKAGADVLTKLSNGVIKSTELSTTQQRLVEAAMNVVINMLPNNMKALLTIKSGGVKEANKLIYDIITKGTSETKKVSFGELLNPDGTKVGSKKSDGSEGSERDKSTTYLDMVTGRMGELTTVVVNPGSSGEIIVEGRTVVARDRSNGIIQPTSLSMALSKGLGAIAITPSMTFGNVKVTEDMYDQIAISNSLGIRVELPIHSDGTVNLELTKEYENILREAHEEIGPINNSQDKARYDKLVADKMRNNNELSLYIGPDGKIDRSHFGIFFIFSAYAVTADDGLPEESEKYVSEIMDPGDLKVKRAELLLTVDAKRPVEIDVDIWTAPMFDSRNHLYEGTLYIPVTTNENDLRHAQRVESESSLLYDAEQQARERGTFDEEESPEEILQKMLSANIGKSNILLN